MVELFEVVRECCTDEGSSSEREFILGYDQGFPLLIRALFWFSYLETLWAWLGSGVAQAQRVRLRAYTLSGLRVAVLASSGGWVG